MKPDLWSEQLEEGDCMGAGASCSEHGCPSGAEMLEVLSGGQILGESLERSGHDPRGFHVPASPKPLTREPRRWLGTLTL